MDMREQENCPEEHEDLNQSQLPFEPFRTMGGKRVYAQDVVDDYVYALREAYAELEAEYNSGESLQKKLTASLDQERAAHLVSKTELAQQRAAASAAAEKYTKSESDAAEYKWEIGVLENSVSEYERKANENITALRASNKALEESKTINADLRRHNNILTENMKTLEQQSADKDEEIAELKKRQYEVVDVTDGKTAVSLMPASTEMTAQYMSLLDRVQTAADSYTYDVKQKADEMLAQVEQQSAEQLANAEAECEKMLSMTKEKVETLLREAKADAVGITQTATVEADIIRQKADETMNAAQQRVDEVRGNARKELADIRALIAQASADYLEISSNKAKDADLFED